MNQRLTVYRRMAAVRTEPELERLVLEVRDRYGPPPESVLNLAEYAAIRLLADRIGLESLDREGQSVVLKFRPDAKLDPAWLFRVVQQRGDVTLVPPATLRLDLNKGKTPKSAADRPLSPAGAPGADGRGLTPRPRDGGQTPRSGDGGQTPASGSRGQTPVSGGKKGKDPVAGGSWWAARAQAGEVAPGFTKDEIMRPAKEDPRAEDGVFVRVSGLLRELSGGRAIG
jgi:transcription-repair coupling factor (superfamily II helicase)